MIRIGFFNFTKTFQNNRIQYENQMPFSVLKTFDDNQRKFIRLREERYNNDKGYDQNAVLLWPTNVRRILQWIKISLKDRRIRSEAFESQLERSLREQDTKFKRLYSKVKKRVSLGIFSDRVKNCHLLFLSSFVSEVETGGVDIFLMNWFSLWLWRYWKRFSQLHTLRPL